MQVARFLKVAAADLLWWHTPNGGKRHPAEARKFRDMGVLAGVPDLTFILPGGLVGFIELKAGKNGLEATQRAFAEAAIAAGAAWQLCRSLSDVETTLKAWGVTLTARSQ